MPLTGTIVNFFAVAVGGMVGLLFRKGLPTKFMNAIVYALGLIVFSLGVSYVLQSKQVLVVIISVILGTLLGTVLRLDDRLQKLGDFMQRHVQLGGGKFSEAFTTCTLLYCVGAMAITGSIQGGLENNHTVIFLKSVMDGVTAVFFASTLGPGVVFSAFPILLYQGAIALSASALSSVLDMSVIPEMSAAGGVALMALALNMLDIKKLNVADMLPSIFFPIGIYPLITWLISLFQ